MPPLFVLQTKTIVKKNFIYLVRKKSEFFKELAVPLISALVIYAGKPQQVQDSEAVQKTLDMMSNMTKLMLPLYLPTAITGFAKKHLISFVQEKHERFKETQKIMGLTQQAYITGWLITSYLKMISIAIITIFALYISGYAGEGFGMISLNFCIYLIASVHQTFAISTVFSSPKLAGEIGTFILTLTPLLYYYITYGAQVSDTIYTLLCLLPQTAISFAVLGGSSGGDDIMSHSYSKNVATYMLIFDVFFYLFLYFYLDEVIPNEYGISRSPFFIFSKKYWKNILFKNSRNKQAQTYFENYNSFTTHDQDEEQRSINQSENKNGGDFLIEMRKGFGNTPNESYMVSLRSEENPQNGDSFHHLNSNNNQVSLDINSMQQVEDKSSAKYHQQLKQNQTLFSPIQIINLKKQFGQMFAVDGIQLNLYESQILCLLGHNGAGKTTTISLLTGLLEKTSGSIKIFGEELEADLDQARQEMGLCTQKDVLYDDMTVTEHLEFIASIKGMQGNQLKKEVEYIISQVGLQAEREKLANNLSGGNKRKLSLGMALTGGSKIIFLDEPTSGMDPVSRQQIWKILEKQRHKRAIILTTHHLDEAERLADRIAIMSKGQLLAVGTSEFIKQKFGVGYHLTLSCKNPDNNELFEKEKPRLIEFIVENINGAKHNVQSSKDTLKFVLPFTSLNQYSQVLEKIEDMHYLNINLQINSLEDAYVKMGLDDEQSQSGSNADLSSNYNDNIQKPKAIFESPSYSFFNQLLAMFMRQHYMTMRNWSAILMILLPIAFNLLGVYVAKHFLDNIEEYLNQGDDKELKNSMNSEIFPIKMYFLQIFIVQAYSMNSSIYINTPVLEREFQLKYALNVMGCRPLPYWLGTLVYDYLVYLLTFLIFHYSVHTIKVEFITPYLTQIFYIMSWFGLALITFCYVCGFLFKNSNQAFKSFPIITFFVSYSIPWIVLQITRGSYPKLCSLFQYIFLYTSPFLALEKAFENVDANNRGSLLSKSDIRNDQVYDKWQDYCKVMLFQAILFLTITMIIEKFQYSVANQQSNKKFQPPRQDTLDEGVKKEINRVNSSQNNDPIKVKQIFKEYPNGFQAVKGTTFGVEKGQIFGLLGPNGAGKSTTFNIITANIPKSSGQVQLNGKEISENKSSYFCDIGVCPQQDCLWEYLLPSEHLRLFGRVKGLQGKSLDDMVEYYIKAMQLESFKVRSANLSGGNKRKLCVANSLIASPSLQFFDEPSTGLDPIAKRYLWRCLKDNLTIKDSSIVLTTHSLQEAEDLCHKVGIQVNGEFVCLDTLQNLKNQKGEGYKINIKLVNQPIRNHEEIHSHIRSLYPEAKIQNENDKNYQDYIIYLIPYEGFVFSKTFSLLYHTLKEQNKIEDFSITQSSLEDIFIYYSKFQIQPRNEQSQNNQISAS
ncbi:hypothetical protein ABPG74_003561 [Tetrahymena malaccensis]